ncbi:MAG: hypothetical protein U0359_28690 [Byssovorax sp.]
MSSILAKPYAERRLVLIVPADPEQVKRSHVAWRSILGPAAGAGGAAAGGAVAAAGAASLAAIGMLLSPVAAGYAVYKGVKALTAEPVDPQTALLQGALLVDHATAAAELALPPGHPLIDHAYAGHPLSPPRYLPAAAFHRQLFEEKVNELLTLLASLGATRVRVACQQGYRSAGGVHLGVAKGGSGTGGIEGSSMSSARAMFEEHFRPSGPPKVPEGLVWLGHEPSWQALAERRIKYNTSRFRAELRYEDSFGIDGKLKAGIERLGIDLGGRFAEFESTVWELEGEFA